MAWYTLLLICWGWLKAFNHSRSCNKETTLIKIALFCWLVPDSTTAPTANEEQGVHWQRGGSEQETAAAKLIQEAQGNQNSVILFLPSKPPTSVMQLHKCPLISTWTGSSSHKAETSAVSLCCPEALTKSQWQLGGLGESFLISSCGDPHAPHTYCMDSWVSILEEEPGTTNSVAGEQMESFPASRCRAGKFLQRRVLMIL